MKALDYERINANNYDGKSVNFCHLCQIHDLNFPLLKK